MKYETLVSKQDYLEFTGIDLDTELVSLMINDVGDAPAERFIQSVENWCLEWLKINYFFNGIFLSSHQKECFKKGVMYQMAYIIKNGDISNDSGYLMETSQLIPKSELLKIQMSENALRCFRNGGMANFMRIAI